MTIGMDKGQYDDIFHLLATRQHEDDGHHIKVGVCTFPVSARGHDQPYYEDQEHAIDQLDYDGAQKLLRVLQDAPEVVADTTAPHRVRFERQWVIARPRPDWKAGDVVEITGADGTWIVRIDGFGAFPPGGTWDYAGERFAIARRQMLIQGEESGTDTIILLHEAASTAGRIDALMQQARDEGAAIVDIARAAGVNRATVYNRTEKKGGPLR